MKRKITELESKLLENGWYLAIKRYKGKHSEKIECYEYHKTSDIKNNGKSYEQIIKLDQKRSQIVSFGIANLVIDYMDDEELCFVKFLYMELKHYVNRVLGQDNLAKVEIKEEKAIVIPISELDEREELGPMTPEQFDELCQEKEKGE